jgi:hypothetical protein
MENFKKMKDTAYWNQPLVSWLVTVRDVNARFACFTGNFFVLARNHVNAGIIADWVIAEDNDKKFTINDDPEYFKSEELEIESIFRVDEIPTYDHPEVNGEDRPSIKETEQ